jgi:hypothetical protein
MPVSFDARLVVPERVVTRAVRDTTVLLNLDTAQSFVLDEVGSRAWTALTTSPSIERAYELLLDAYRAEPDTLRADLVVLIDELASQGLLEVQHV